MADDKTKRGSPDNKRLNKGEPYEVAYARKKAKAGSGAATGRAAALDRQAGGHAQRQRPRRGRTGRPETGGAEGRRCAARPIRRAAKRRPRTPPRGR